MKIARIGLSGHDLWPRGTVVVHNLAEPCPPRLWDMERKSHVRRGVVRLEDFRRRRFQNAWTERSPALPILDLGVDPIRHACPAGVTEYAAVAQGTGTELHGSLKPGKGVACGQDLHAAAHGILQALPAPARGVLLTGTETLLSGVGWSQIDVFQRPYLLSESRRNEGGGTKTGTGIPRSRLHKKPLHLRQRHKALV